MPISKPTALFATPKTRSEGDAPNKADLVGAVVVVDLERYDPALPSKYGSTPAAFLKRLIVVDGPHKGTYEDAALFGAIARNIGESLDEGQAAPGRVISGTSKAGSTFYGLDFLTPDDPAYATALDAYQADAPAPF